MFAAASAGRIFQYDPRTDAIREPGAQLPIRAKGISLGRDYDKSETAWRVIVWDEETKRFDGVEESASTLLPSIRQRQPAGENVGADVHSRICGAPRRTLCDAEPYAWTRS
jgi:hypothetical protein